MKHSITEKENVIFAIAKGLQPGLPSSESDLTGSNFDGVRLEIPRPHQTGAQRAARELVEDPLLIKAIHLVQMASSASRHGGALVYLCDTAEGRAANQAFIDAERERMRALLFDAAVDDKLAYTDGPLLDVFIEGKAKEATAAQLEALDGE